MSQHSTGGTDFSLPDEILAVIPMDPYEQLDLARKITSMAIASRVSNLESEMGRMKHKMLEKDHIIFELQEKLGHLQRVCQESESKLSLILDENVKLSKERDSLAMTAKKLGRDLAKLETFKRQLMQSLSDDSSSQAESVDIGTCDQSVPRVYPDKDEGMNAYVTHHSFSGCTDTGNNNSIDEASRHAGQRFSITPYITPRRTPTRTPNIISTSVSPKGYSAAGSPQRTSGATSPTKPQYDKQASLSSWYPSSQQSSAANSPPRGRPIPGRPPRMDGKEFFRQARSRLSYEQFSAFLANIKKLNGQEQTREETLRKAEEIFGTDNKDLYFSFRGLLNRNIH
uniref:At4g15545-like C-terminal domain-containing protein n=1 Tax=Populus davidiana TaxID=266767 RepID=A0A6M2ESF0_9ROSI